MNETNKVVEYTFKLIVIGDTSTGKSSFIQRYVFNKFSAGYKPTIGVDFMSRTIQFDENTLVRILLWDIAGQERFGGMTRVYYKDAVGCILLFDLSNYNTFESVRKWKDDLDTKCHLPDGGRIPCVLVGNKCDLPRDVRITNSDLNDLMSSGQFTAYCRTSTKSNQNVNESLHLLISEIDRQHRIGGFTSSKEKLKEDLSESIKIDENKKSKNKSKCAAC